MAWTGPETAAVNRRADAFVAMGVSGHDDRLPWLDRIVMVMARLHRSGIIPVATCSALRRAYRDRLNAVSGLSICYIFLDAPSDRIAAQIASRVGHFMPLSLLPVRHARSPAAR